jgi:hypothetical protein
MEAEMPCRGEKKGNIVKKLTLFVALLARFIPQMIEATMTADDIGTEFILAAKSPEKGFETEQSLADAITQLWTVHVQALTIVSRTREEHPRREAGAGACRTMEQVPCGQRYPQQRRRQIWK